MRKKYFKNLKSNLACSFWSLTLCMNLKLFASGGLTFLNGN